MQFSILLLLLLRLLFGVALFGHSSYEITEQMTVSQTMAAQDTIHASRTDADVAPYEIKEETEAYYENAIAPMGIAPAVGGMARAMPFPEDHESYSPLADSGFSRTATSPLSTFAADVDTASYANIRRMINAQQRIQPDAVRIEELINAFSYSDPAPEGGAPLSMHTHVAPCPWNENHLLLRIAVKAKTIQTENLPPLNLVFLIDSSGSMEDANKLPLVKRSFALLTEQLRPTDRVSIVTYAGSASILLEGARGDEKAKILSALDGIASYGSTAGAEGIETAYEIAERYNSPGVESRVLLATDGDFNVGISSEAELTRLIEIKKDTGVFLSVLGYGMGNLKDDRMQALANHGNGNATYIDTIHQARRALVEEMGATLATVAKDVKLQVEFNPATVEGYRLIGYENRRLSNEDFRDDSKDGGEIGSGHSVVALYELIPAGAGELPMDDLVYQQSATTDSADYATVYLRYKEPEGDSAKEIKKTVGKEAFTGEPDRDFSLSAALAAFGLMLSGSEHAGAASEQMVLDLIQPMLSDDTDGRIIELSTLVRKSGGLYGQQ